ncbi:RNA polymerase sigma factor [Parabacteroides pacaensis]|uniref:RNA polymerase sigma factor n=1 Tax=Parabacteroides pacaensis TaxID=2086575 RepID=UPI000D0F3A91|nr:RNA polymerase sigma factor [Parabacteroides pacaensis]
MLTDKERVENKNQKEIMIDNLYKDYVDDLYRYALGFGFDKQTAMDAIHDIFCKLCLNEYKLENIRNPKFYLLRILRNRLIDIYKLKKDFIEIVPENSIEELPYKIHITIEDELIAKEEQQHISRKIEEVLSVLTERQREIIYLRYIQECTYEEIAEIMNLSVPACHKMVYRILNKLKNNHTLILFYLLLSINVS